MSEFRIDISDLKSEDGGLVKELITFLEEETNANIGTIENEIVVKGGEEAFSINFVRALLKDFLKKVNIKGKVKTIGGNTLIVVKSKGKPIFCGRNGRWIGELEKRLETEKEIVLLAQRIKFNLKLNTRMVSFF